MVITKNAVMTKLDDLEAYCVEADGQRSTPSPGIISGFFSPVRAAVNTYFSTRQDVSALMNETIEFMYFDLYRRTVVYEHNFEPSLREDFPVGYNDVSLCFYQFPQIMGASGAGVYAAFVYGVPADDSSGVVATDEVPLSNALLGSWPAEIAPQPQQDIARLTALDEWCQDCGNADLISLFEDQGRIVSSTGIRDGGVNIYLARNALSVIEAYPLTSYIPSWLNGFYIDSFGDLAVGRITEAETFELDDNGDVCPCVPAAASTYFEIDAAGNIMARSDV